MEKQGISAPWYTYQKKLAALFGSDPDVLIGDVFEPNDGSGDYAIDIEVRNHEKYLAFDRVLPRSVTFGNVKVAIFLYDEENENETEDSISIFKTIFEGNPVFKDVKALKAPSGQIFGYVRFEPEVVQFFNDDLADYSGNWTGLAQDIAREVFGERARGVYFCTADIEENEEDKEQND